MQPMNFKYLLQSKTNAIRFYLYYDLSDEVVSSPATLGGQAIFGHSQGQPEWKADK